MSERSPSPLPSSRSGSRFVLFCLLGSLAAHGVAYGFLRVIKKPKVRQRTSEDIVRRRSPEPPMAHKVKVVQTKEAPKPMVAQPEPRRIRRRIVRRVPLSAMTPPMASPKIEPMLVDFTMSAGVNPELTAGQGENGFQQGTTGLGDPTVPPMRAPPRARPRPPLPPPPMPRPRRPRPVRVYVKTMPRVVQVPRVPYPRVARREGVEGTVKLEVTVGKDGRVLRVKVLSGVGYGLDQAAVRALQRARFKPAMGSNGKPMVYTIRYRYTFRLER